MSEIFYKDVPSYFVIILLVNGFLVLFLTPIQFWIPLINPLAQHFPSEAVASVGLATIASIFAGSPGFLFGKIFITEGGVNNKLRHPLKDRQKIETQTITEGIKFATWAKNSNAMGFLNFYAIKYAIINGIIIGSEIAGFINGLLFLFVLVIERSFSMGLFLLGVLSLVIFFITWAYDKFSFKKGYNADIKEIKVLYSTAEGRSINYLREPDENKPIQKDKKEKN